MARQRRIKTSAGRETASQTVSRINKARSSYSGSRSSNQIGLNSQQVSQLRGNSGINQGALDRYENSGSAVGGRNNPNGRGRESTPVIPSDKMTPMEELRLPTPTAPTALPDADMTNASLAGFGTSIEGNKFIPDPSLSDRTNAVAEADFKGREGLQAYINSIRPQEGQNENALLSARKQSGLVNAQEEVNRYQNQINVITGKRDSQILGLEDQGRGISETIIGGQQARISREAAIMAIPLQAQLAAAQGNLEVAATLMGQLFTAKSADIAQNAQFRQNVGNALLNYSNTQQANLLTAKMADISDKAAREQADLSFLRQNVDSAIKSGATAAEIGNLSSDSLTTAQKVALSQDIQARNARTQIGLSNEAQRASIANTYDQIAARGAALRQAQTNATTEQSKAQIKATADTEQALRIKQLANELLTTKGFSAAIGVGFKKSIIGSLPFVSGDAVSGTNRADFEAKANRLANLLTLDNLKLMSGVLTDRDIQLLATAGSNLGQFNLSETAYKAEINRVVGLMDRTISNNGITTEQAVFFGTLDNTDAQNFDVIWNNL